MNNVGKIWINGKFVNYENANVHILSHTLHYGSGVFEGIRAYKTQNGTAIFRLSEHIDRLFYSASCLEIKIPFSKKEVKQAVINTIKINKLEECYIRPLVFLGQGMGLNPSNIQANIAIAAWKWDAYLGGEKETINVKISKYIRIHPDSTITDAKICGHYVNSILASLEIKKAGFDEALLLDFEGYVAEGPGENIFIIKDNKIFTPPIDKILNGITRDIIINSAKEQNIEIQEKKITVEELKSADEAFFTGTAVEICAIGKIDNVLINNDKVGKITKKIQKDYSNIVRGEKEKYLKYLTFTK